MANIQIQWNVVRQMVMLRLIVGVEFQTIKFWLSISEDHHNGSKYFENVKKV